jgi:hypothetical protein
MSLARIEVFSTKDFADSTDQGGQENLAGQAEEGEEQAGEDAAPPAPPQSDAPPAAAGGGSTVTPGGGGGSRPEVPLNMPISGS